MRFREASLLPKVVTHREATVRYLPWYTQGGIYRERYTYQRYTGRYI